MKLRELTIFIFAAVLITGIACDNDNDDSGENFPDSLQKVWQDEFFDDGDELGIYFLEDKLFAWDYFGDTFDQGDDCYFTFEVGTLKSRDGDLYTIETRDFFTDEVEEGVARLVVQGDTLFVTDVETSESEKYSDTGMSASDLTPECTFKISEELIQSKDYTILNN